MLRDCLTDPSSNFVFLVTLNPSRNFFNQSLHDLAFVNRLRKIKMEEENLKIFYYKALTRIKIDNAFESPPP